MILPLLPILTAQPLLLHRQPVRLVGSRLGDEIDFEACGAEDSKRVQGFGYEEACISYL